MIWKNKLGTDRRSFQQELKKLIEKKGEYPAERVAALTERVKHLTSQISR